MESTDQIIIPFSRTKIVLLILGAVALVAGSVLLLYVADDQRRLPPTTARIVSILGIVFFTAGAIYGIVKVFDKRPGLVLDREGIIDNSSAVAAGRIPWSEIQDIQTANISGQTFLAFYVSDPEKYLGRGNILKRGLVKANYKGYGTPIFISTITLKAKLPELEHQIDVMRRKFVTPSEPVTEL